MTRHSILYDVPMPGGHVVRPGARTVRLACWRCNKRLGVLALEDPGGPTGHRDLKLLDDFGFEKGAFEWVMPGALSAGETWWRIRCPRCRFDWRGWEMDLLRLHEQASATGARTVYLEPAFGAGGGPDRLWWFPSCRARPPRSG
jgi:hypothetical protein